MISAPSAATRSGRLSWRSPIRTRPATRRDTISIGAGTLDGVTGLRTAGHWYVSQAGDYYEIDDGLPRHERGGDGDYTGSSG